jgi:hypothetical protein
VGIPKIPSAQPRDLMNAATHASMRTRSLLLAVLFRWVTESWRKSPTNAFREFSCGDLDLEFYAWTAMYSPGPRHHPNVRRVGSCLWTTEARARAGSQTKFTIQTSCRRFPLWPPSSRGILSPSPLLALLYYFAQVRDRPYLNRSKSILKPRLL